MRLTISLAALSAAMAWLAAASAEPAVKHVLTLEKAKQIIAAAETEAAAMAGPR
jgi:hypothetical protein